MYSFHTEVWIYFPGRWERRYEEFSRNISFSFRNNRIFVLQIINTSVSMQEKIIILDFGSQTTQLIGRRLRELNVYCEIVPYNKFPQGDASVKGGAGRNPRVWTCSSWLLRFGEHPFQRDKEKYPGMDESWRYDYCHSR